MKNLPFVSIIIHNFNGLDDLNICLNSLLKTDYPNLELFVIDTCTPNFENWIKKFPTVKFFHLDDDIGTSAARNLAYEYSNQSAEYICFMDDDVFVTPQWLSVIISFMEKYKDTGQVQPVLYQSTNKSKIDSLGHLMTHVGYPFKIEPTEENLQNLKLNNFRDIFYSEGAISVIRKKTLLDLNDSLKPFDEKFFFFFDDVDLSWRIWSLGYRVVIVSDSFCYHDRGISKSIGKYSYAQMSRYTKNRLIMLIKNQEIGDLIKYFPITIFLEISKALVLLRYNPKHSKAILCSIFWIILQLPKILKKRKDLRKNDLKIMKLMSKKIFVKTNLLLLNKGLKHHYS